VVVVGAGITGLTAAYLLTRAGRRVVLLERAIAL
jgi:glycine/D-amino acid oxidase-like deaminating enzyme